MLTIKTEFDIKSTLFELYLLQSNRKLIQKKYLRKIDERVVDFFS